MADINAIPPIQFKRSDRLGHVPTANDLLTGELALNFTDKRIYTKDSDDNIISLGLAAAAEGNALVVADLTTTQYPDISTYLATLSNIEDNQLVAANIATEFMAILVKDAATNVGEQYRFLVEKDVLILSQEYFKDNPNLVSKEYSREFIFTGTDFIGQPTEFDFNDQAKMHRANLDIDLIDGDVATFTINGLTANGNRTIKHLWNATRTRWEAAGDVQFYTTGNNITLLESYWPAADSTNCVAKVYDVTVNAWKTYIARTAGWTEKYKENTPALSFPFINNAAGVAGAAVGNAVALYEADDSLCYYQTNTGNTTSQNNTRVSNTSATAKYWNVCSDGQGDVNVSFTITNAYDSRYDVLHMFDQTSQGWVSNSKTSGLVANMAVTSVTQGTYKPEGFTVRGRNVSTSTDYIKRIDWTITFSDGHTWTTVTTGADRYTWQPINIPLSEYGDPASTIGVTNVRMVLTRGSSWGGLWGFQMTGHYRDMYPSNGLYVKSTDIGDEHEQITRIL